MLSYEQWLEVEYACRDDSGNCGEHCLVYNDEDVSCSALENEAVEKFRVKYGPELDTQSFVDVASLEERAAFY